MNRGLILFIGICFFGAVSLIAEEKDNPYRLESIEALLFYNQDNFQSSKKVAGTFSPNVIDNADFHLWNTIIGEGSAEGHSDQSLVIVKVSRPPTKFGHPRKLEIEILEDGKPLLKKTDGFSIGDLKTQHAMAYLLSDTGCSEIVVKAKIMNEGKVESNLQKTIPFGCGE